MKLLQVDNIPNFYRDEDSGIYYAKRMVNGKVIWRSTGQTARGKAWTRANQLLGEMDDIKAGKRKAIPTLSEWWTRYRAAKRKAPTTWKRDDQIMTQHWLPQFGRLDLNEISRSQVERQMNWRRKKGAAESTVTREMSLLYSVFEAALDDDLLEKNPLRNIERSPYAARDRVVSLEEQATLLGIMPPMLGRWFQFMLGTGLRADECRGLNPDTDIDWVQKLITVTGKGSKVRRVPLLSDILVDILKAQLAENAIPSKRYRMDRTGHVWGQRTNYFGNELRRVCKRAKVAHMSPHTLRHTFATRYILGGGDIFVLSKILGHASVAVTQKHYAHVLPQDLGGLSKGVDLHLQAV